MTTKTKTKTTYRITRIVPATGWGDDRPYSEADARAARSLIGRRFVSLDAAARTYRALGLDQHGDMTLAEESERGGTWSITTEEGWRGHSPRRAYRR